MAYQAKGAAARRFTLRPVPQSRSGVAPVPALGKRPGDGKPVRNPGGLSGFRCAQVSVRGRIGCIADMFDAPVVTNRVEATNPVSPFGILVHEAVRIPPGDFCNLWMFGSRV